ncbi:MAG: gamma-glutamylcyclotransferase family protein [Nitrospirales bacterium]
MRFFVYGDNLNPTQLKRRAPEHQFVCKGYLPDHTLQFCRWSSQWRCGLASVGPSPGEQVWGIILEITDEDLKILDDFEGEVVEGAFRHLPITVINEEGEKMLVMTHAATPIGKFKPKAHYLEWVIKGVNHWKLPEACLESWRSLMPSP